MRRLLFVAVLLVVCANVNAQAPLSLYHNDDFVLRHELNPAFQPDSDYLSIPILGNVSFRVASTLGMSDLLCERPDGTLTTFMGNESVSKLSLMEKVGRGMRNQGEVRMSLLGLGQRISNDCYRSLGLTLRVDETIRLSRGLFDCMKDVSNGTYDMTDTHLSAKMWVEAYAGESRRLDEKWTVGAKAKLLLGIWQAGLSAERLRVDLSDDKWMADGIIEANVTGMRYNTVQESYKGREGKYEKVKSVSATSYVPHGIGLSFDAGAEYKWDEHWTFSASLLDVGFLTWFGARKARNIQNTFEFDGFHDATISDGPNSVDNQLSLLEDQLSDLVNLSPNGSHAYVQFLHAISELGASCQYGKWNGGALLTTRIQGDCTWVEGRLAVGYQPISCLKVNASPAFSNYGKFSMGLMVMYTHPRGYQAYLGSDSLFGQVNPQLIPVSLNGAWQFGVAIPLRLPVRLWQFRAPQHMQ